MTVNKDFKRLVRARMARTGESYTAARRVLLRRPPTRIPHPAATRKAPAKPVSVSAPAARASMAELAGMADAKVKAATGCDWQRWVAALDYAGAYQWPHREIAAYVSRKFKVKSWWTQMVTVGYERIKGLRTKGQRRNGTFSVSKSRTFPASAARLYRAFTQPAVRKHWLPEPFTIRTRKLNKTLRLGWPDRTVTVVAFLSRGRGKSTVAIDHSGLATREQADELRERWAARLSQLAGQLASSKK